MFLISLRLTGSLVLFCLAFICQMAPVFVEAAERARKAAKLVRFMPTPRIDSKFNEL